MSKKHAERYYELEYKEKWRGSTMKAIVISAYLAGYEKGRTESD